MKTDQIIRCCAIYVLPWSNHGKNWVFSNWIKRSCPILGRFKIIFKKLGKIHCVKNVRIRSFSGPHFSAFGLNTKRYGISLRVQSEYGHFSRSDQCKCSEHYIHSLLPRTIRTNMWYYPEAYSEPSQTSKMELFGKIVILTKTSILDVRLGNWSDSRNVNLVEHLRWSFLWK